MRDIPFGTGVFSESQAARLLGVQSRTIRRWWRGYKYRPSPGEPVRTLAPVGRMERDLPSHEGKRPLSFLEFAELVVVTAFINQGLPLQRIRSAAEALMKQHGVDRPFAYKRVFTDGRDIFLAFSGEARAPDLVKLTRDDERLQIRAGGIEEPFVVEIGFSDDDKEIAEKFYPRGKGVPIVVDPNIAFGAPVIAGTRITIEAISAMVRGSSVEETAAAYDLSNEIVKAALDYEASLTHPV